VKEALTKTDLIRGIDLFSLLKPEGVEFVAEHSGMRAYEDGEIVYDEGAPGDALFMVAQGSVAIDRKSLEGGWRLVAELEPGEAFGELELLTEGTRNARAMAQGHTRLLRFPKEGDSFNEIMRARPEVAAPILKSFLAVISGRIRTANKLLKENSPLVQELKRQVYGDKLTGLYNKTFLEERLPEMLAANQALALLMLKPDNFKHINDTYGHDAGDAALVIYSREFKKAVARAYPEGEAPCFRYSGNEIGAVVPGAGREGARRLALDLKAMLEGLDISQATGEPSVRLSISMGISLWPDHGPDAKGLIAKVFELPLVGRARGGSMVLFPEDL
jgi:diguanylate cyclase (GGDEF)-like protein